MLYTNTPDLLKEIEVIKLRKNIKNKDIAEQLNKSTASISSLLHQKNISLDTLNELCSALDYQIEINIVEKGSSK